MQLWLALNSQCSPSWPETGTPTLAPQAYAITPDCLLFVGKTKPKGFPNLCDASWLSAQWNQTWEQISLPFPQISEICIKPGALRCPDSDRPVKFTAIFPGLWPSVFSVWSYVTTTARKWRWLGHVVCYQPDVCLFGIIDGFGSIQQHISCAIMVYRKSPKDFSVPSLKIQSSCGTWLTWLALALPLSYTSSPW